MSRDRVFIETFAGSHKLYREGDRYILADYSGPTPETTDDGILWVNTREMIRMGTEPGTFRTVISIPVILARSGQSSWCGENPAGAFDLAHRLGMKIKVTNLRGQVRAYTAQVFEPLLETKDEEREAAEEALCC